MNIFDMIFTSRIVFRIGVSEGMYIMVEIVNF